MKGNESVQAVDDGYAPFREHRGYSLLSPGPGQLATIPPALPPTLTVLVDAEEDFDWSQPFSTGQVSVASMRHQHRAQTILEKYRVVPTYVVDFPVASQPDGYMPLKELLADGKCDVGAQLHPWVNPPHGEAVNVFNSFPGNLPRALEAAKLARLTDAIEANIGVRPTVYKAGRYGLGPHTSQIIEDAGFRIDTSVAAFRSFSHEGGADFTYIGPEPYWFGSRGDLLELPLTCGFTGALRRNGIRFYPSANSGVARAMRIPGVLARTRLLERIPLTPEGVALAEAKRMIAALLADGARIFVLAYHSPSLEPGNTPYVRDQAELRRFLDWIDGFCDFFFGDIGGRPATPCELLEILKPGSLARDGTL